MALRFGDLTILDAAEFGQMARFGENHLHRRMRQGSWATTSSAGDDATPILGPKPAKVRS